MQVDFSDLEDVLAGKISIPRLSKGTAVAKAPHILLRRRLLSVTPEDMAIVEELSSGRNCKEAKLGAMTYARSGRPAREGRDAHRVGLVGEIACSRFFGMPVDKKIYRLRGDKGIDLEGLIKIAVKWTAYPDDPWLRVEVKHFHRDVHAYVGTACTDEEAKQGKIWLFGWATPKMVESVEPKVIKGPLTFSLKEEQVKSIDSLKFWLDSKR